MPPDLPVLDHEQPTEASDHSREHMIRKACIEAITQATAAAKTNRALRTESTITGQHHYDDEDLTDYHRPTTTKDDWGGWNGTFPVARNDHDRLASQCLIRHLFRIENVVSVGLAKRIHKLPPVGCADNCTLVHYDNDVNPGHYYEAEGTALNIHGISGTAHSRIIKCLKSTGTQAGFDQDMTKFEASADIPTQDGTAREAPKAKPPQEDGRPPTIYEDSEADPKAHIMEVRHTELQDESELLEATPLEDLFTVPTKMIPDNSAPIA
eukprot:8551849-Pyramimonas_sp.AAC.1